MTGFEVTSREVVLPVTTSGASNQIGESTNTTTERETQLKSPIWEPLTRDTFQRFILRRKEMVCRLTPYADSVMKIEALPGIQLPVYDSYFIIRPDRVNEQSLPTLVTDDGSIAELVSLENTMRIIRTEYVFTDSRLTDSTRRNTTAPTVVDVTSGDY